MAKAIKTGKDAKETPAFGLYARIYIIRNYTFPAFMNASTTYSTGNK